ncbi:MAG: hypothetical protein AVDCRST_MAG25-2677, partial [uncultured Rubrobacteraceae bacterium]
GRGRSAATGRATAAEPGAAHGAGADGHPQGAEHAGDAEPGSDRGDQDAAGGRGSCMAGDTEHAAVPAAAIPV